LCALGGTKVFLQTSNLEEEPPSINKLNTGLGVSWIIEVVFADPKAEEGTNSHVDLNHPTRKGIVLVTNSVSSVLNGIYITQVKLHILQQNCLSNGGSSTYGK